MAANRILRDWTDSFTMDKLDAHAERFFVRLIMKADDYGRFHADPRLLKANLFPLKTDIRDTDISRWIAECVTAGLITVYNVAKKEFLQITNFNQRLRQKKEKFPPPAGFSASGGQHADMLLTSGGQHAARREVEVEVEKEEEGLLSFDEFQAQKPKFPSGGVELQDAWDVWKKFLETEKDKRFKTFFAEEKAMMDLMMMANNSPQSAIEIINRSIAKNWASLYPIDKEATPQASSQSQARLKVLREKGIIK